MRDLTARKKATEKWRKKNPKWWRGKQYVKALNNALRNQNPNAKVWLLAGMSAKNWIADFHDWSGATNGAHLEPIVSWSRFNMGKPSDVRRFLAPENFRVTNESNAEKP